MKYGIPIFGLVVAFLAVLYILTLSSKEKFSKELVDMTQEKRTMDYEDSSYVQRTNHFEAAPYSMAPLEGTQTPFQVNQFKSYIT
jgi:hypothetical protein